MEINKPKLYLTDDEDGIHLWFSLVKPKKVQGVYQCDLAANKIRLPRTWYDGIVPKGECKEHDPADVFMDPVGAN